MKINAIKPLVEIFSIAELEEAQSAIENEQELNIEVQGEDEGEKLTHIIAAIWIKKEIQEKGSDFKTALRAYTGKVRNSIN